MKQNKLALCVITLLLMQVSTFLNYVFAEIIVLKSGRRVKGNLIEETDTYIKLDIYGIPITFYRDEIQTIEEEQAVAPELVQPQAPKPKIQTDEVIQVIKEPQISYEARDNLYIDEKVGFRILTPAWIERGFNPRQIEFNKDRILKKGAFTTRFLVSIDKSSRFPNINSSLSYAQAVQKDIGAKFRDNFQILDPPKGIIVNGNAAATLTYKVTGGDSIGNTGLIFTHYFYYLGRDVVMLMFADGDRTFNHYIPHITKYLRSFKKLAPEDNLTNLMELSQRPVEFTSTDYQVFAELKDSILNSMNKQSGYKTHLLIKEETSEALAQFNYYGMELEMTFANKNNFEVEQFDFYSAGLDRIWRVSDDDIFVRKIGLWTPLPNVLNDTTKEKAQALREEMRNIYKDLTFDHYLESLETQAPIEISENLTNFTVMKLVPSHLNFLPFKVEQIDARGLEVSKKEVLLWISNRDKALRIAKTTIEARDKEGKPVKQEYTHYFSNFDLAYTLGTPPNIYQENE